MCLRFGIFLRLSSELRYCTVFKSFSLALPHCQKTACEKLSEEWDGFVNIVGGSGEPIIGIMKLATNYNRTAPQFFFWKCQRKA